MFRNKITTLISIAVVLALMVDVANADFTIGEPTNLGPNINTSGSEWMGYISPDGLELYFASGGNLWVATRPSTRDPWGTAAVAQVDFCPSCISPDGLEGYFHSDRPGGSGAKDIWVTTRDTTQDDWGPPVNLGPPVNSTYTELSPSISSDGLSLFFSDGDWGPVRPGGQGQADIWIITRASKEAEWSEPVNLGSVVNSSQHDVTPSLSSDGLLLFFGRGSFTSADIWMSRRKTTSDPWEEPIKLGLQINNSWEGHPHISPDGASLYWTSDRVGGFGISSDIWQVSIKPIVDFNSDGIVDAADMCIMIEHWLTDYQLCDIGPMPWGDGIVDVQDLIVLSEHLFGEVNDPTLVAHWALDEAEGMIVTDSVGDKSGYAMGDPLWQPDGGQVNGALEFDGVDDFVSTPAVLNPADGPFSVFVWVKGGAPGQAIISEPSGSDWLSLDPLTGHLMTELGSGGRDASFLFAETTMTDGNWHRIGLVWDGLCRTLVVDGVLVAEDTQDQLESRAGGFYIGVGKDYTPDSFFSGLIDDVRVYSRAVKP